MSVQREREQRGIARDETEARARDLCGSSELESSELGVLTRVLELGRLAPAFDLDCLVLRHAVGRGFVRRVRDLRQRRLALGLGRRELLLEGTQPILYPLQLLDLLRRRLAVDLLPRAELVDLRDERAPAPVRSEQLVECVVGAPAPERGAERLRVVTGGAEVDHARESRYASSTWATPSSSTEGQTKSARSFTRSCAFATATP